MKLTITEKAAEKLRGELLHKCFEYGIGFRLATKRGRLDEVNFNIRLDRQYEQDIVIAATDVKLFLDPSSVVRIYDYELDWSDEPDAGFFLKTLLREGDDANMNSDVQVREKQGSAQDGI